MRTRSVVTETFSDFNTMAYLAETAVNEIATAAVSTAFVVSAPALVLLKGALDAVYVLRSGGKRLKHSNNYVRHLRLVCRLGEKDLSTDRARSSLAKRR